MNNNIKKILSITLFLILIITLIFSSFSYADHNFKEDIDDIAAGDDSSANTAAKNMAGSIIASTKTIALGIAIIMLVVLGIKYMSAAPDEKASIKKSATIYVVGALLMFSITGILSIIQDVSNKL